MVILFSQALPLNAQVPYTFESTTLQYETPIGGTNGIIRVWMDDLAVICNRDTNGRFFFSVCHVNDAIDSGSAIANTVLLMSNAIVNDFVILNDTVYFCGTFHDINGFLGWFCIRDLLYSSSVLMNGYRFYNNEATHLNKIGAYKSNSGSIKVATIGNASSYNTHFADRVFELDVSNFNTLSSDWCLLASSGLSYVTYDDIIITDDYVIIAGRYDDSVSHQGGICLRKYRKGLFNSTDITYNYLFSYGKSALYELSATNIKDNRIAIAGAYRINDWKVYVSSFNIVSMDMVYNQIVEVEDKSENLCITYVNDAGRLVLSLIHAYQTPWNIIGELLLLNPWSAASLSAEVMYDWNFREVRSMDVLMDRHLYCLDQNHIMVKDGYQMPLPFQPICYASAKWPIAPASIRPTKTNRDILIINRITRNTIAIPISAVATKVTSNCIHE